MVRARLAFLPVLALTAGVLTAPAAQAEPAPGRLEPVRFATFNASLSRAAAGQLVADLSTTGDARAREVAEVIQRSRPDVLLINEFDYVPGNRAADLFRDNYLERGQNGAEPIHYPYAFGAPSNTGLPTGFDLNRDGRTGTADDAQGFGFFPGQYGMLVLSKYPIDTGAVRTFQEFRWKDMPGAILPDDPATPAPADWYSPEILDVLRLPSKSHWDLPIRLGRASVHFLVSHPTPPTFDGTEDRNGTRNHDEIRFWADYVTPGRGGYIYDDAGGRGGLHPGARFVIAGDNNSDPHDGDSVPGAIDQLLNARRVIDTRPGSLGGYLAAREQGGANQNHKTPSFLDTADFNDDAPGNLRVDYVLPSRGLLPVGDGVFWPTSRSPLARLNGASDHHLVHVDVIAPGPWRIP
ncbi:endonuclease/exonuclease/phosphatase family protein [Amycolatopsis cihanbeyliensis]|uniref:Endonuclease/exonuclease/phosphatase family protein n=1 Tax=Amycolatopsis cihanbeyliensis TaxID=1128664 RepID=A0A542DDN4_AMYCI|nr:endonuclease/exonuclease/phosphatase family protein [Amycolatopsis cihanbeyliensis]TQJ01166.1 endonuclease/exonuclease/phosphatase family protein [Amycolatopsis cihanbeyliensis]